MNSARGAWKESGNHPKIGPNYHFLPCVHVFLARVADSISYYVDDLYTDAIMMKGIEQPANNRPFQMQSFSFHSSLDALP